MTDKIHFTLKDKCCYVCAKRNSGKSVLIKHLVQQQKHLFNKIFLINPSESLNGDFTKDGLIDKRNVYDEYNEDFVDKLIDSMTKINDGKSKTDPEFKRVLLVLDDCMADFDGHHSPSLKKLLARGRHMGIALIFSSQMINGFPPICRQNSDFVLVSQLNNAGLEVCQEEFSNGISKKQFAEIYRANTKDYNFLLINQCQTKDNTIDENYGILKAPHK